MALIPIFLVIFMSLFCVLEVFVPCFTSKVVYRDYYDLYDKGKEFLVILSSFIKCCDGRAIASLFKVCGFSLLVGFLCANKIQ